MSSKGYAEAFAAYGAKLVNVNWAVSAIADDGALVVSCWKQYFIKNESGNTAYRDTLSRWGGSGALGKNLLKEHLTKARSEGLPVRIVIASAENPKEVETATDASKIKKTFHIRKDWVGNVALFDGDNFDIEINLVK